MKKIPIQITDENTKFINDIDISFSKFLNYCVDNFKELNISKKEIKILIESGVDFKEIFV